jgi:NhaA family Na+:H+ antiporter
MTKTNNYAMSKTKKVFLKNEANMSIVAILALLLAVGNSIINSFQGIYAFTDSLNHFVFPFFFFYVSLEARRQIISETGHLRGKKAIQPLLMAIGGVAVPMGIFAYIFPEGFTPEGGMFIPIATDIAFVVLAMKGTKISDKLKSILLAIAIADDIIGIGFLATSFESWDLGKIIFITLIGILVIVCMMSQKKIDSFKITRERTFWLLVCSLFIYVFHILHIHTTVAGVICALMVPYHPGAKRMKESEKAKRKVKVDDSIYHVLEEDVLSVLCGWFVIPAFIILNVNIPVQDLQMTDLLRRESIAIISGLFIGKTIGIFSIGILTAYFFGFPGKNKKELLGGSMLCGIGFTVSLFFATLSTGIEKVISTVAILTGSLISGISGLFMIRYANNQPFFPKIKKAN